MNDIPQKQNEPDQLDLLLAQSRLYSRAKICFTRRICLALVFAIVGPILSSVYEPSSGYVGLAAFICLLLNLLVLERVEGSYKLEASKLQELFDTYLFSMPWNEYVLGRKPDRENVAEVLGVNCNNDFAGLRDWYAVDVGRVDLGLAVLLCQRSNAWWDTNLRKRYLALLISTLAVVAVIVVFCALAAHLTLLKLILGIVVPTLPLIEVAIIQLRDNKEATITTNELKENIDREVENWMQGRVPANSNIIARTFQDQIWRHRSKCPMVFDWVNGMWRPQHEHQMQFSVRAKVEEFLRRTR